MFRSPSQPLTLRFLLLPLLAIACLAGCDRGAHPGQIGKTAPAIALDLQNNAAVSPPGGLERVTLDKYRGKVVVLSFWASWCPPCLEEFPSLIAMQQQMPDVVVLAVSFDTDAVAYREYLADNHITLRTALDQSQRTNLAFGTTRPPETFVIDRQGIVRRKFIGAQDWVNPEIVSYIRKL